MDYQQHFSEASNHYLQFRPDYPSELYDYLIKLTQAQTCAWDCGTGNGQAAIKLAEYFQQVIATDISKAQIAVAPLRKNINYMVCPAEKTPIESHSVDLITVAQALHWFDLPAFYEEAKRVLKPMGVLAVWCYSLGKITPPVDKVILYLYEKMLGDNYWPPQRKYIDDAYATIPFPFEKIAVPSFCIKKSFNFQQLLGYLNTWSAVKEYTEQTHQNPLDKITGDLLAAWGKVEDKHEVTWPIHLLAGRIKG